MAGKANRGRVVVLVWALAWLSAAGAAESAKNRRDGPRCRIAPAAEPTLLRQCAHGKLYRLGPQRLLVVWGTPHQMGFAHGRLLREQAKINADVVLAFARASDVLRKKGLFAGTIGKAYARLAPFIPHRYQEEMRGLAEGAGVPLERVRLANVFPALFHCTGFALMGKATRGGRLLHGRILDYMTILGLQKRAVTVLARPDGRNAFVNVTYAGFIGSVTGMNDKQIAVGEMGGRGEGKWDGMPMPFLMRKVLEEASTLGEALDIFRKTPRTCEYYYVVSDGKIPDARGLHCTPEKFESIRPGQKHAKLAAVVDDAVILSGADRLKAFARRVRARYGKIDAPAAVAMMARPVSMRENLHNVLFAPREMRMWVAHAARVDQPHPQACYQPYQPYDVGALLGLLPSSEPTSRPATQSGRVPASKVRRMAEAKSPAMAKLLAGFRVKPQSFAWRMRWWYDAEEFAAHALAFPSPFTSPVKNNNTVHCEYYVCRRGGRRPGVIVLHILDGRFRVARVVCRYLATQGIHSLLLKMPYYGPRRPADLKQLYQLADDPEMVIDGVRQAIMDVRRAARWLACRDEVDPDRIGLCGVSLGGFCAAAAAGVDGGFPRVAIILGGGDLLKVISQPSPEIRPIREAIEKKKLAPERLKALLRPIDPLTYAARLRGCNVLMVNGRKDTIVPPECAARLAKASGAEIRWYPATHYSMALFLPVVLERVGRLFAAADWSAPASRPAQTEGPAKAATPARD